jgi:myo-inositol 2-dehydrogenase / D-chiro-inositol 1-dehydrogenase
VNIGLIGCGRIAQLVHLNLLQRLPGVSLTALAEADPARRAEAAQRAPHARAFAEATELIASGLAEAVVICLPSHLHAATAQAALAAGLHLYLEKPLASDLADGQRVVAAWQRAGRVGMIGYNYRFNALYQALRHEAQSGALGNLVAARTQFSTPARALPAWKQQRATGGGVLLDLGSHHLDLVPYLAGQPITAVSATLRSLHSEADNAQLHLRLAGGVEVQSLFSFTLGDADRVELYGEAGQAGVDRYRSWNVERALPVGGAARLRQWAQQAGALVRSPYLRHKLTGSRQEPSYAAALTTFVAAVRGEAPAAPDLADGLRALAVIAAAETSARTGSWVSLPAI